MEVAVGANMLRITRLPEQREPPCLRVEGRLVGDWVHLLQVEIELAQAHTTALELDLLGVEFADARALSLLHEVERRGVKLVGCSPLLTSLLESQRP
jgi:ABC-type transporter Mla MlaB component